MLRAVVRDYVQYGRPVGSQTVGRRYGIKASSATIRLDMSVLVSMGLLRQPHTSSGRIPTASGYRTYVRNLPVQRLDSRDGVLLRSQVRKAQDPTEALVMATRTLADLTQLAALAAPPLPMRLRLTSLGLRQVSDRMVLLSYVLSDGTCGEVLAHLEASASDEQVGFWRQAIEDLGTPQVASLASLPCPVRLPEEVWQSLVEHVLGRVGAMTVFQGISHLAAQPEFSSRISLADLLALVENHGRIYSLLSRAAPEAGATALIDAADTGGHLPHCSLIVSAFGPSGSRSGRVAVLGPMRMHYDRALAATTEAARLLDRSWAASDEESEI